MGVRIEKYLLRLGQKFIEILGAILKGQKGYLRPESFLPFPSQEARGPFMRKALQPWEFLLLILSGRANLNRQKVIDGRIEENRIPKGRLREKRIRFTDEEHRKMAVKGKGIDRKLLERVVAVVAPDTILAWN